MNKEYKTVDEQIKYLKDNKKIIVKDEHRIFLKKEIIHHSSTHIKSFSQMVEMRMEILFMLKKLILKRY